jgi:hypothetical protein
MSAFAQLERQLVASVRERRAPARAQPRRLPHRRAIVLAVVALLVLGGSAIAATGVWRPVLGTHVHPSSKPTPPVVRGALGVLERRQTDADRSSDVVAALRQFDPARWIVGPHLGEVRLLARRADGISVLAPFDRRRGDHHTQLCLLYTDARGVGGSCGDAAKLRTRGIGGFMPRQRPFHGHDRGGHAITVPGTAVAHYWGLVPNGVANVRLTWTDGSAVTAAVTGNYYDASSTAWALPRLTEWLGADGSVLHRQFGG